MKAKVWRVENITVILFLQCTLTLSNHLNIAADGADGSELLLLISHGHSCSPCNNKLKHDYEKKKKKVFCDQNIV